MDHDTKYYRKPWMSDDQWECAKLIARVQGGFHHCAEIKQAYTGIRTYVHAHRLATFDFNLLTELVFEAHDRCIRVELAQSAPGKVGILLHKRHAREGRMYEYHPTIEQALADWRTRNPTPQEPTP